MFKFKTKFTEEDLKLQELVKIFLNNPETLIEIDPSDFSYILSLESLQYFIMVDGVGIKISNHNFAKDIRLEQAKVDTIKKLICDEASKRRQAKIQLIFKNNIDLLDTITNNILKDGK